MSTTNTEANAEAAPSNVPSLAQTHMQGPLEVNGSGKALTKDELEQVKEKLKALKLERGLKEPVRSFMDDTKTKWRFGGPPDYSLTNYLYLQQRTKVHKEGSLEQVVENLVKTWEMERSHKLDYTEHKSVDQKNFRISANGGKIYNNKEANQVGNYNVLLDACPAKLWDKANISWEKSHDMFHTAFAAFPWEVLEVFSPPPKVAFTWRHWGNFTGTFEKNQGNGQLVEMFGFGTATVNSKLQLCDVEIFYNAEEFINVLRGTKKVDEVNQHWAKAASGGGCPFLHKVSSTTPVPSL
uniref:Pathogen-related protein n=1 Tax=Lotharella globosa TaxID=91324 RepID=A0A7S3Z1D5_9EUKA